MSGKQLAELLIKKGWVLSRVKGSHHIFTKEGYRSIPVPIRGNKDLPVGLIKSILKQSSL
jgi:predicted RNA binding protein YcfA (HicA-like mRNA interferase family)